MGSMTMASGVSRCVIGLATIVLVALARAAPAEVGTQAPATFEVATIRPAPPQQRNPFGSVRVLPGGRLDANIVLRELLYWAYELRPGQRVIGAQDLLERRFVIVAKAPDGLVDAQLNSGAFYEMMRNLLVDRFRLSVSWTEEMQDVTVLRQASGVQLRPGLTRMPEGCRSAGTVADARTSLKPCRVSEIAGRLTGTTNEMTELANYLMMLTSVPVVDETGLTGSFGLSMSFDRNSLLSDGGEAVSDLPPFKSALRDSLGLTMESGRRPIKHLIVERVDGPVEN